MKLFTLSLLLLLFCGTAGPQEVKHALTQTTPNPKAEPGRWQIVNPISEVHARTFLLDTQTGDTWMICGDMLKGEAQWCPLDRVYLVDGKPVHVSPTLKAKP